MEAKVTIIYYTWISSYFFIKYSFLTNHYSVRLYFFAISSIDKEEFGSKSGGHLP